MHLLPGERVHVIVKCQSDAPRWNLEWLANVRDEDLELAAAGIDDWAQAVTNEDNR